MHLAKFEFVSVEEKRVEEFKAMSQHLKLATSAPLALLQIQGLGCC